jgi:hypothetical protein
MVLRSSYSPPGLRAIIARPANEWVILIVNAPSLAVLTMGVEDTYEAALEWGEAAIKARGWMPGRQDPPDAHDRARHRN